MTETPATFPGPEIPTILADMGTELPKTEAKMTHLEKKNTNKAILQKMRKKYVYKTDMHNIYNLIVGQNN